MIFRRDKLHIALVFIGLFLITETVSAAAIAMVSDLEGSASSNGESLEILAELEVGARVELDDGGHISIVYYDTGQEFTYGGPAEFKLGESGPATLSGEAPAGESVMPEGEGAVSTVGLAQAAMVMRAGPNEPKLTLLFPVETVLLEAPEAFEWKPLEDGAGYALELTDFEGRSLIETTVTGGRLAIPEHVDLVPGEFYTWSLETRLPDGRKFSNWAGFSIADDELRERVEAMKPTDENNVSRLVVYALWLEQHELMAKAQEIWDRISALRPEAGKVAAKASSAG